MSASDDFKDPILEAREKDNAKNQKARYLMAILIFAYSFYQFYRFLFMTVNINAAIFWGVLFNFTFILIVYLRIVDGLRKIHGLIKEGSQ